MKQIRLGTRGSRLALMQSQMVADELIRYGHNVEIVVIRTEGDSITGPLTEIGGAGVFTSQLQNALLFNEIDLAVHSLKDLPTIGIEGLTIAAVPQRENPQDALVLPVERDDNKSSVVDLKQGARVGTGSNRRKAQLLRLRSDLRIDGIRGNVDTRLQKLDDGDFDALVLACAGLIRSGLSGRISYEFTCEQCAPAVGQGALALEIREEDLRMLRAVENLNHPDSFNCAIAERAMLAKLDAGCLAPVGAISNCRNGLLSLEGVVLSVDGKHRISALSSGPISNPTEIGSRTADALIDRGAGEILRS